MYDEVSEEQYKSIVKTRLQKDNYFVDDAVDGYTDNGMIDQDWNGEDERHVDSYKDFGKTEKKCESRIQALALGLTSSVSN